MNAHAHLLSLGWAGPGHALDSRPPPNNGAAFGDYKQKGHRGLAYDPKLDPAKVGNTGAGLVKPLSVSVRKQRFGIGKKAHEPASGNQWWLKGFENALGNIGKSESERSGTTTPVIGGPVTNGKHGGLYGFFIRGQLMEGTIAEKDEMEKMGKKRKSDVLEGNSEDTGSASDARENLKNTKRVKKDRKAAKDFVDVATFIGESQKSDKRVRQKEKGSDFEQFVQVGQFFDAKDGTSKRKIQNQQSHEINDIHDHDNSDDLDNKSVVDVSKIEKEERRARRRARKEEKISKTKLKEIKVVGQDESTIDDRPEDEAARAIRKAERKKRRAEQKILAAQ